MSHKVFFFYLWLLFEALFSPGLSYFFNKSVSEDFEFISGCSARIEKKKNMPLHRLSLNLC